MPEILALQVFLPKLVVVVAVKQAQSQEQGKRKPFTEANLANEAKRIFSQQGRKGHKEGFSVSNLCGLCGLAVKVLSLLPPV